MYTYIYIYIYICICIYTCIVQDSLRGASRAQGEAQLRQEVGGAAVAAPRYYINGIQSNIISYFVYNIIL